MAHHSVTLILSDYPLPDELIHHVGQVGQDEDEHNSQGQVGGFYPCSWDYNLMVTDSLKN